MITFEVGKPMDPRRMPRPEGVHYQLERGGHVVYAFFRDPDRSEVAAYQHGKIELAVYVEHPVIFVLMQAGTQPWCDAPYSWHLVPDEHKPQFDADSDASESATIVLADSRDTTVRALRVVTMPRDVSDAIRRAMRAQAASPWNQREYDTAMTRITNALTTQEMLARAQARGRGGT